MAWTVNIKKKVLKKINRLPKSVQTALKALIIDIEKSGPIRGNWPNYSVLLDNHHHCHLKKGHPTYVAMWRVESKEIKLVEVTYAGSHEKAPY